MNPDRSFKPLRAVLAAVIASMLMAVPSLAGVADLQFSTINEIVRVSQNVDGGGGRGSGSIFENFYNPAEDQRYLCVITADHVLKLGNGGSIAFGNTPYDTNFGPFYNASHAALGQYKGIEVAGDPMLHHPDLGVMVVPVPDTPFFQGLVPFNLVTPIGDEHDITIRGFGLTGPFTSITTGARGQRFAYVEDLDSYGTQRFYNNTIEEFELRDDGKYRDLTELFTVDAPLGGIIGEGVGMRGDSGGPMLNYFPMATTLSNHTIVPGFTLDIEAVFTHAFDNGDAFLDPGEEDTFIDDEGNTRFIVDFTNIYAGVVLLPEYIDWARGECEDNIPEPGTAMLLGAGLGIMGVRRSRRR